MFSHACAAVWLHKSGLHLRPGRMQQSNWYFQLIPLETATLCCVIQAASSHSAHAIVQGPSEENLPPITWGPHHYSWHTEAPLVCTEPTCTDAKPGLEQSVRPACQRKGQSWYYQTDCPCSLRWTTGCLSCHAVWIICFCWRQWWKWCSAWPWAFWSPHASWPTLSRLCPN